MKKLFKFIFIVFILLLVLLTGAGIYLYSNSDQLLAKSKNLIEEEASNALSQKVKVGKISLSLFPPIGLEARNITLSSPKGVDFNLDNLVIRLSLKELVDKKIHISKLFLNQPQLLIKAQAKTSKEINPTANKVENKPENDLAEEKKSNEKLDIDLDLIQVADGSFKFFDTESEEVFSISNLNLKTPVTLTDRNVSLASSEISFSLPAEVGVKLSSNNASFDLETQNLSLPDLQVELGEDTLKTKLSYQVKPKEADFELRSEQVRLPLLQPLFLKQKISLKNLKLGNLNQLKLIGKLKDDRITLENSSLNLNDFVYQLPAAQLHLGIINLNSPRIVYNLNSGIDSLVMTAKLSLKNGQVLSSKSKDGTQPLNLDKLAIQSEIEISKQKATLKDTKVNFVLAGISNSSLQAKSLVYEINSGNFSAPQLALDLGGSALNAKVNYVAKGSVLDAKIETQKADLAKIINFLKPFSLALANLDLNGIVSFNANTQLTANKFLLGNFDVKLEQLRYNLEPYHLSFAKGDLVVPLIDYNLDQGLSSLKSKGSLVFKDGLLTGLNLARTILASVEGLPFIKGDLLSEVPENIRKQIDTDQTPIKEFNSAFEAQNNQINISSLSLESAIFAVKAKGQVEFNGELNLEGQVVFSPEFSKSLAFKVKELNRSLSPQGTLIIPLKIRGSLSNLKIIPDTAQILENSLNKVIEEKADKYLNKLFDKLNKKDKAPAQQ